MDTNLMAAFLLFKEEIKRDLLFFGSCGFAVGLFTVWQARLSELGVGKNAKWASELFADFISFNAFGLVFLGYLFFACLSTVLADIGRPSATLDAAVSHSETRLMHMASSITAFMLGVLALVILYSALRLDLGGLKLIALSALFCILVVAAFFTALAVGRRSPPFNRWWAAVLCAGLAIAILGWLLIQGGT